MRFSDLLILSTVLASIASANVSRLLKKQLSLDAGIESDPLLDGVSYDADRWTLTNNVFSTNRFQIQPYVSNGYIGARLPLEGTGYAVDAVDSEDGSGVDGEDPTNGWPLFSSRFTGAYIAGFWDLQSNTTGTNFPELLKRGGESVISTLPVWSSLFVKAHGDEFSVNADSDKVHNYSQSLSLKDGIVETELIWAPNGNKSNAIGLKYEILAHRVIPTLAMERLVITSEVDTTVKIADILEGAGSYRTQAVDTGYSDSAGMWSEVQPHGLNNTRAFEFSQLAFSDDGAVNLSSRTNSSLASNHPSTISQEFYVNLNAGEPFTVYKYVGIASTDAYVYPKRVAIFTARVAAAIGWRLAKADHVLGWHKLWEEGDIIFPGDIELQISARASIFHLLSALRSGQEPTGRGDTSIAVSGLSSDSYAGQIFWDADTWMHPGLSVLYPKHAENINNFRQRIHDQSIENAQSYNLSGAIYSWTSGRFGNCSATGPCVDYQYHINVDIAQAHWSQFLLSNDTNWLAEKGYPIIRDAADMFASYVIKNQSTGGYYYTLNMTDPDEYANHINNGAFTNAGISKVMSWARRASEVLGLRSDPKWQDIEENIYLPIDEDANLMLEFTTMNGSVEIKQADVVLINYPLEFKSSYDLSVNNLDFYAMAQSADGPAMTWAIFAINAAELSPSGCASYTYLLYASQPYLRAPFYQFSEQINDNATTNGGTRPAFPFLTGHGGFLQVLTHGFTGFRPREDAFYLNPALPPQIENGYIVKGMKWRNHVFDVSLNLNETIIYLRRSLPASLDGDFELEDYLSSKKDKRDDIADSSMLIHGDYYNDKSDLLQKDPVVVRIGSGKMQGNHELRPGEQLVVPTRRSDLNGTIIAGNVAQCQPAISNTTWVSGHFPISAVDGSNSTSWQPQSRNASALLVDLGQSRNVSGVSLNWGRIPPTAVSVGFAERVNGGEHVHNTVYGDLEFKWPIENHVVNISTPYDAATALNVRLHVGNVTEIDLSEKVSTRWMVLVIEGSHDTSGRYGDVGATVAEFAVIEA
ncbi:glycosyl hydrolase family 65 central catalytic domain-containing protein [Lipomyces arxii]|uniref:glycosyl hydrolase family 65 central catalytic domain-containing protein n=1 Tax=Lipomyces arxii TaxID=56418 RepID=UPI0034D016CE